MDIHEEVMRFISRFTANGRREQVIEAFTSGCCAWFARNLYERFKTRRAKIMYDEVANHFGCRIGGRVYDITGDVTDEYRWMAFTSLQDGALVARIRRDCINF